METSARAYDDHLVPAGSDAHLRAQVAQDVQRGADVGERGHVAQHATFGGEQRREEQWQGGVFRPAHHHLALEAPAALNDDLIHAPPPRRSAPPTPARCPPRRSVAQAPSKGPRRRAAAPPLPVRRRVPSRPSRPPGARAAPSPAAAHGGEPVRAAVQGDARLPASHIGCDRGEERIRIGDQGQAPAASDVVAVLDVLAQAQRDAEERWQAVMRLAPAAKRHRARAEAAARSRARMEEHLDALERLAARAVEPLRSELRAWAAEMRSLLAADDHVR